VNSSARDWSANQLGDGPETSRREALELFSRLAVTYLESQEEVVDLLEAKLR